MATAASRSGSISVETTEQGLPTKIDILPAELGRPPAELAAEILRLCKRSSGRAGLARRRELEAAGMSSEILALTGLPTQEDIAHEEYLEQAEYEYEPQSWLRSI
ncbi:hypothetical protein GCM10011588_12220 [Nocardia jinanensis]|uniref:Uncharacterized protein n=1 Tax=Nocardia jinanensis TaxID=382504 RepID=A0A917RBI1_9NOCA|nr:hypothetical protein GCM10011588_12220 [Nocardia jinanensis]